MIEAIVVVWQDENTHQFQFYPRGYHPGTKHLLQGYVRLHECDPSGGDLPPPDVIGIAQENIKAGDECTIDPSTGKIRRRPA